MRERELKRLDMIGVGMVVRVAEDQLQDGYKTPAAQNRIKVMSGDTTVKKSASIRIGGVSCGRTVRSVYEPLQMTSENKVEML